MKMLFLSACLFMSAIIQGQIFSGQAPLGVGDEFLVGDRLRALRLTAPASLAEQYLGIADLANPSYRIENDLVYTSTTNVTFTYNAVTDSIYTTVVAGGNTYNLQYGLVSANLTAAGKARTASQMNVWQMAISNQQSTSTTTVSNIVVNGAAVPGSFSNNGVNSTSYWYAFNNSFGSTFTFSFTITLSGTYGNNAENNRVEMLWGSSFAALPEYFKRPVLAQRQEQWYMQWQTDAGLPVQQFELERSANGRDFYTFAAVQPNYTGLYDVNIPNQHPFAYYRIAALLAGGVKKYSAILHATESQAAPVKIWRQNGQVWVQPLTGTFMQVRVTNAAGQLLYAGRIADGQAQPLTRVNGALWVTVETAAGKWTQGLMP